MPPPNLFIVGPPRSATTSMASWLSRHPDIHMSNPKEPGYYAADLPMRNRIAERRRYLALFDAGASLQYRGEATPWYLYSRAAADAIRLDMPAAHIVVHLRNPIDLLVSLHNHHVFRGIETELDFERAVFAVRRPSTKDFRYSLDYLSVARIGDQVERFAHRFPEGQIHFVRFEQVDEQPEAAYRELLRSLGAPVVDLSDYPVMNVARRRRSMKVFAAAERFIAGSPSRWRRSVRFRVEKLNTVAEPAEVPAELRSELTDMLEPQIRLLEKLSGEDLSAWLADSDAA
jgi:Sulfotransferase family